jgi:membrane-bound lytic murein transglycosylase A
LLVLNPGIGMVLRYTFMQGTMRGVAASLVGAILCFAASGAQAEEPLKLAGTQLEPVTWTELAGWTADDHLAAFAAYQRSCQALVKRRRSDDQAPIYVALWNVCQKVIGLQPPDSAAARTFFEQNFQPVRIARPGETEGLLTGYFEPIVQGSRFPNRIFHFPLYRRPPDLVADGHKPGSAAFPNKGRIGRLNEKNQLVPYYDRGAIEAGALDGQGLEICWLKDPLDLIAIQMEGSGRVILEDGTPLRISYDSHNGYSYSSITDELIKRNLIPREEMSMQRIRDWMAANPDEAAKVRATNRSYVFFRITGLSNEDEPVGAQGVPLTPGRSIAVDAQHEYGTPFFIEADLPIDSENLLSPFHRLVIAQDTGSAIVGPARADVYWGAGDNAGRIASRIRHRGRFVMLVPRELDIMEAAWHTPLPMPRPRALEVTVNKKSNVVEVNSDEHRRVATKSVQPAGPARLQPPRTRCSSCVPQPNQIRETVSECCGPRNSSDEHRRVATRSVQPAGPAGLQPPRTRCSNCVLQPNQVRETVGECCGPRNSSDEHRRVATRSVQPAGPARLHPPRTRCSSCVPQPNQVRETAGECCGPRNSSDEDRRVATKSVQPAGPARLQPPRTRCSNCVLQPNQVRETVGRDYGPKDSGRGLQTQKPDKREFVARLRIGPERPHRSLPEPSNKHAPRQFSPPQAAKPITRSNNL